MIGLKIKIEKFWQATRGNNWLWRSLLFFSLLALAINNFLTDTTFRHLQIGQALLQQPELPNLTFLGKEQSLAIWYYPGWLGQLVMAVGQQHFGFESVNWLSILLVSLTFGVVWRSLPAVRWLRYVIVIIFMLVGQPLWRQAGPHLLAGLCLAVFLWLLESYRQGKKNLLWWTPVITLVWVNSHGSASLGLFFLFIYGLLFCLPLWPLTRRIPHFLHFWVQWVVPIKEPSPLRRPVFIPFDWFALLLTNFLVGCLNPLGSSIFTYPLKNLFHAYQTAFQQTNWQSPNFQLLNWLPLLLILGAAFFLIATSKTRISLFDLTIFSSFALLTLFSQRFAEIFGIVGGVYFARLAYGWQGAFPNFAPQIHFKIRQVIPINLLLIFLVLTTGWLAQQRWSQLNRQTQVFLSQQQDRSVWSAADYELLLTNPK